MRRSISIFLAAAATASIGRAQMQTPTEPILLSGDAAPGTGGLAYSIPTAQIINASGQITFTSFLSPAPSTSDFGIWTHMPDGTMTLVAREGSAAPGASNASFRTPANPYIDADGTLLFYSELQGAGVTTANDAGLWIGTAGNLSLVARKGDAAPGTAGQFNFISESALIESNRTAFRGTITGAGINAFNNGGIWGGQAGAIQLIAREGAAAAGLPAGVVYDDAFTQPSINNSGTVVFYSEVYGTGITTGVNNRAIWKGTSAANNQLIVQSGKRVPGTGRGVVFEGFGNRLPTINASGSIAFAATLTGTDVDNTNNTAILQGSTAANVALIARGGDSAGGLPAGVNYFEIGNFVVTNNSGLVVFNSTLVGTGVTSSNDRGVFAGTVGNIGVVARRGDAAPGAAGGVVLNNFDFSFALNAGGQVAMLADLAGTGVVATNNRGIYAVDPFNQLVKIAREGDSFTVAPGDTRTIGDFGLSLLLDSGGVEGRRTSFNESGQLVFSAFFSNNTRGVFSSRVGGAARITATPPVLGPAVANGYYTITPANLNQTVFVAGDIGFLKFKGYAPVSANNLYVYLDFQGDNLAGALAELHRGETIFGYQVSGSDVAGFDILLKYANANTGIDRSFYWNFGNTPDADLIGVMVTPEPDIAAAVAVIAMALLRRTRRQRLPHF